jgi:uncharacterized repeat protein (TIGR02543 family)
MRRLRLTGSDVFGGWYADSESTAAWNFSTLVTANLTLYAKWIAAADAYTVRFAADNGSAVPDVIFLADKITTKAGYVFEAWYKDANYYPPSKWTLGDFTLDNNTLSVNGSSSTYTKATTTKTPNIRHTSKIFYTPVILEQRPIR